MPGILCNKECTVREQTSQHFNLLLFDLKIKEEELGSKKTFVKTVCIR
jgi:hypothetical protein